MSQRLARLLVLVACVVGCRAPAAPRDTGGCGFAPPVDPLAVPVADAQLVDVKMWQAGFGIGHSEGDATLVTHDADGNESSFDARLDGYHYGLVADASVDETFGAPLTLDFEPGVLTIRDLLGEYQGQQVGVDVGVGGHYRNLTSGNGVVLNITTVSFGVGATPATWESLDLELWDDPLSECPGGDGVCDDDLCGEGVDPDCV